MNARLASDIKKALKEKNVYIEDHEIDYYNSRYSIGVECDYRVIITVGLAYKPANTFDVVAEDSESSYTMLQETVHADTFQAISRAKDPQGKKDSFVFMLGSNLDDVENVVKWGVTRIVRSDMSKKRRSAEVIIRSEPIAKPVVEKCKDVDDMLAKARGHRHTIKLTV
jgi:hypothetical protein